MALWLACPYPHAVGHGFASRSGHIKDHRRMVHTASLPGTQAFGMEFGNAARLFGTAL